MSLIEVKVGRQKNENDTYLLGIQLSFRKQCKDHTSVPRAIQFQFV